MQEALYRFPSPVYKVNTSIEFYLQRVILKERLTLARCPNFIKDF